MTSTKPNDAAPSSAGSGAMSPAAIHLSIVIVTWNNARIIHECLNSLASVDNTSGLEIIIVDNDSSDGTPELIQNTFPHVTLVRSPANVGFAAGNNAGIRVARGDYLCLINSDVVVPQGCVEKLLQYIDEHHDIGVLGPKMILPDGSIGRSCLRFPTVANWIWRALALDSIFKRSHRFGAYLMTYFKYDRITDVDVLTGWFWVVRRQAISQVGLLDERFFMYGEDMDWCKRFKKAGWRVVFYPEAAAIHHCGASSSKAPSRFYVERTRAGLEYCKRHHNPVAFAGFRLAVCLHEAIRLLGYGLRWLLEPRRADAAFKVRRSWACLCWLLGLVQ